MRPVFAQLYICGHSVFSYIDNFFGKARPSSSPPTTLADIKILQRDLIALFNLLGPSLQPRKCDFSGATRLEMLGILIDTTPQQLLLSPKSFSKLDLSGFCLHVHTSVNRRHVPGRSICQFDGLAYLGSARPVRRTIESSRAFRLTHQRNQPLRSTHLACITLQFTVVGTPRQ